MKEEEQGGLSLPWAVQSVLGAQQELGGSQCQGRQEGQHRRVSQAGRKLWHGGLDPLKLKAELPVPSVSSVAWKEENSHDRGLKLAVKQEHPVQQWAPDQLPQGSVPGIALGKIPLSWK